MKVILKFLSLFLLVASMIVTPVTLADKNVVKIDIADGQAKVELPDGSVYEGSVKNGRFNGIGKLKWGNGDVYEGEFLNGLIQGSGRQTTSTGDIYTGNFVGGLFNGLGKLKSRQGDVYVGEFKDNYYHGKGVVTYSFGDKYEGEFKAGVYSGKGAYYSSDGTIYEGNFSEGTASGPGKITWSNGNKYEGMLENWRMSGEGVHTEVRVGTYSGQFVDGYYEGKGIYTFENGDIYKGEFKKGFFEGEGELKHVNGNGYSGSFKGGKFHGKGEARDASGRIYRGNFDNGKFTGSGEIIYKNGDKYIGEIDNWIASGKGKLVFKNGDVFDGGFSDGLMHGEGEYSYKNPKGKKNKFVGKWTDGRLTEKDGDKLSSRIVKRDKFLVEEALYNQYPLLGHELDKVEIGKQNIAELYFLSFGAYGEQDVFMKEAMYSRELFNDFFRTNGRAITLINNKKTTDKFPMATVGNLKRALNKIGEKMNREEDILFLFISSHGSKKYGISVRFGGLYLEDLSVQRLVDMLKESKIKWKVIVLSACYSGDFIEALKDDYSMIITSSKPDHVSFGCSDEAEFTFFGRAFFKKSLRETGSFRKAFEKAKNLVHQWEVEKKYSNSEPQLFSTGKIEKQLNQWRTTVEN